MVSMSLSNILGVIPFTEHLLFLFQFENCFAQKPRLYMTFWSTNGSPEQLLEVSIFSFVS